VTNYIWQAKDRSGKPVVREILATTAAEAKSILTSDGYTDLKLFQDDTMAAAVSPMEEAEMFGEPLEVSAEDRIKQSTKPQLNWWRALWEGIRQTYGLITLLLVLAGWFAYRENYTWALSSVGAIVVMLVFIVCVSTPAIYYNKLNQAVDWNRWDEVLDLVRTLETNRKINFIKVPEVELKRNRAKALAGLGRVEEGLAEYRQCAGQPGCPSWLHKAFIAGIYDTAKQYDKAIEYTLLSLEEKENPSMYVDLAYRLARHKRDVVAARKVLAKGEQAVLAEMAKPFLLRARGWVCYLEHNYAAARSAFEEAIQYLERNRHQPFHDGSIAVAKAHLACVLAKQGEFDLAKKSFAEAKKYLEATDEKDLLDECRNTIGVV
jgi:tetratricopeptide (TPR) repeat protein